MMVRSTCNTFVAKPELSSRLQLIAALPVLDQGPRGRQGVTADVEATIKADDWHEEVLKPSQTLINPLYCCDLDLVASR